MKTRSKARGSQSEASSADPLPPLLGKLRQLADEFKRHSAPTKIDLYIAIACVLDNTAKMAEEFEPEVALDIVGAGVHATVKRYQQHSSTEDKVDELLAEAMRKGRIRGQRQTG